VSLLSLDAAWIADRRGVVAPGGPLAPLAASLARDLAPVVARPVWLPAVKARLTRVGGTCPRDGARLESDPFARRAHRCPACGAVYDRDEDHAWWAMGYQLWLAERAVHAAALALLGEGDALGTFAARVLDAQAAAYPAYPNVDNALGPTRPFFSTYLESLWLVHVCTTLDLLRTAAPGAHDALAGRVLERVVEPSRTLIAGFPEGTSNRQVWHATARLAAARLLGERAAARDAVHGPHGLADLLGTALLADGSWYEGDNYHQFAHRGLWYGLRFAERAGIEIAPALVARFRAGYEVPFRVALPDDTLPARRDSQYAVSLRQWRWAEWCELGLTDGAASLGATLARLYAPADPPVPHRTGRWRATGESERYEPASALSRADLGWKSLLFARPELTAVDRDVTPRAVLLPAQGYAVLRRDGGRVYAALDYGGWGGGHGHPDRLNVILQDGPTRWLDDPGTGTYVERTLHWYRSTLAHAAPLVDGRSQDVAARGVLAGFDPGADESDDAGASAFAGVAGFTTVHGVRTARTLVASATYVVDLLTWRSRQPCVVDLPFPVDGAVADRDLSWAPFDPRGAGGLEDGFDFVHDAERAADVLGPVRLALRAPNDARASRAALWLDAPGATLWRATGPGPPGHGERRFHAVRMHGRSGAVAAVWDLRGTIASVRVEGDVAIVAFADGHMDRHRAPRRLRLDRPRAKIEVGAAFPNDVVSRGEDWCVARRDPAGGTAECRLALGPSPAHSAPTHVRRQPGADAGSGPLYVLPADGAPLTFELGESHYVRSEPSWREAGAPTATARVFAVDGVLTIDVDVRLGREPAFAPRDASNPMDNERPEVNSDGVQLLVGSPAVPDAAAAWLLVPEEWPPAVRVIPTSRAAEERSLGARWIPRIGGWRVTCALPYMGRAGGVVTLDVAVNEKPPGRERRQGQLQLGESDRRFVYLRGDRLDASRALRFLLPPAVPAP